MSDATRNGDRPEVSIIVESYNHAEGSSLDQLAMSLRAALRTARDYGSAEVLLADSSGDRDVAAVLKGDLAEIRRVDAAALGYDGGKSAAISEARGDYVLFLDGDVIPDHDDWAARHVAALREGAVASTGVTRYDGGFLQELYSLMDFGFLLPYEERDVRCYASNNAGFRAETLRTCPIPPGPLRCQCYHHADQLRRRGTPARLVTGAMVEHEKQPYWEERFRRGFDQVGTCWSNKDLPEARLVKLGPLAAPLFYARDVIFDWRRLMHGRRDLGLSRAKAAAAFFLLPILRLGDLAGILRALVTPPRSRAPRPATETDSSQ